ANRITTVIQLGDAPFGGAPFRIAIRPNGLAYVTAARAVVVLDTATNEVITTIPVARYVHDIAIDPDDSFAYVTIDDSPGSVMVIDMASNTVIGAIQVGGRPQGIAITPNGQTAYVANLLSNSVSLIDTATLAVVDTIVVGDLPSGVAITPAGDSAYVTNSGLFGYVSVINTQTRSVTETIALYPSSTNPVSVAIANVPRRTPSTP
ncbi:MAG TPA: YncE family protein, partial [Candidatus Kryptonia bacterium]|nr:YncE family protein [Candidatus Kryptonia bacterium]